MKDHGDITKVSDREYRIRIRESDPPLVQFLTFVHEVAGHAGAYIFAPFSSEKREHRFIAAVERSVKRHFKKYWEGV